MVVPWVIVVDVLAAIRRDERLSHVVEIHETRAGAYALVARVAGSRLPPCAVLSFGLDERYWQAERAHLRVYGRRHSLKSRILVPLTLLNESRLALRTAEAVVVLSSVDRDYVVERLAVPSERVTCAFTGVSGEHLFEIRRVPRRVARVLFLGSWIERKGTTERIAAWRRLAAERPEVRLTIAGTGDSERVRTDTQGLTGIDIVPELSRATSCLACWPITTSSSYRRGSRECRWRCSKPPPPGWPASSLPCAGSSTSSGPMTRNEMERCSCRPATDMRCTRHSRRSPPTVNCVGGSARGPANALETSNGRPTLTRRLPHMCQQSNVGADSCEHGVTNAEQVSYGKL